ncbi:MAG: response regulator [Sphingomonadales bacterium]|nr:response regulator [Sphingomonadales bacterium]
MPSTEREPQPACGGPESQRARILIVDDDERNLLAIGHVLKDIADVVTASSGRDALRQLMHGEFAVILLDVFMPGMDGYEVAELVRQRRQTAGIPIIFLSAVNKEVEHLLRGYSMGAVDYVFKPVDPLVLTSKVSVFVDLFEARRQIEAKNRAEQDLREAGFRAELERLQIESELHATRARQAAMLDALPLALFEAVAGKDGALSRCFVAGDLSKLVGDEAAEFESGAQCWEARIHPDDRATSAGGTASAPISMEYRWICSDGSHRHFLERMVSLDSGADGPIRWAGTLFDVTERKNLESQLVQAGKMDALGRLTGGVAHDFNNVLAAVLAGTQILARKARLDEPYQRVVEQIGEAAQKGADLVRRMMAFARKQDLKPVHIPVASLCESVSGLVEHALGGIVTLHWTCDIKGLAIHADRSLLELALVNLIINARDAMPAGGSVHLTVLEVPPTERSRLQLDCGDYVQIEVRDEGTGMDAHLLERIVEPFFTTKAIGKGTGLGLSMVAGFVQQSGGRLEIDSKPGQGTTVRLTMCASERSEEAEAQVAAPGYAPPLVVRSVLLVDDDPLVRNLLAEQLRHLGVSVTEADSGSSALARLQAPDFAVDLLLSDFAMPGLNGLQTAARARALRPDLACVLMTGHIHEMEADVEPDIRVLRKPVPIQELEQLIQAPRHDGSPGQSPVAALSG